MRLVDRKDIEAADWNLTPGRSVGVAPPEEDGNFDFEQTLRDIHTELADLNKEAAELAAKTQENFEELGASQTPTCGARNVREGLWYSGTYTSSIPNPAISQNSDYWLEKSSSPATV